MMNFRRFRITEEQFISLSTLSYDESSFLVAEYGYGDWTDDMHYESYSVYGNIKKVDFINLNSEHTNLILFLPLNKLSHGILTYLDSALSRLNSGSLVCCFYEIEKKIIKAYFISATTFCEFNTTCIVGDNIHFSYNFDDTVCSELSVRTEQTFGKKTTNLLSRLTVGVIGVSGTGSIVAEQLYRLNIGRLILVDDETISRENLGRILNSKVSDAEQNKSKTEMFAEAITNSGLPTKVTPLPTVILSEDTIKCLSQCDVIFGCIDSIDGRHHLNLISTFYTIPYFDVGVKLQADGYGGISEVSTAVHYVKPGGSSLFSRRVYNHEDLTAASLKRSNPEEYIRRLDEKYIKGAKESSPAVISINMVASSMAVMEFLARVHPFREEDNSSYETICMDLMIPRVRPDEPTAACMFFKRYVGKGNVLPLLNVPL